MAATAAVYRPPGGGVTEEMKISLETEVAGFIRIKKSRREPDE